MLKNNRLCIFFFLTESLNKDGCLLIVTVVPVVMTEVEQIPVTFTSISASTVVQVVAPPRTARTPDSVTVTGMSGT